MSNWSWCGCFPEAVKLSRLFTRPPGPRGIIARSRTQRTGNHGYRVRRIFEFSNKHSHLGERIEQSLCAFKTLSRRFADVAQSVIGATESTGCTTLTATSYSPTLALLLPSAEGYPNHALLTCGKDGVRVNRLIGEHSLLHQSKNRSICLVERG